MAQEVQAGLAFIHGIRNDGSAITITGVAGVLDSAKLQHKFELEENKDELGFTNNLTAVNDHFEVDIAFMPASTTRALAEAAGATIAPLAKVTLAHFAVAAFNGDYVYIDGMSIDISQKQGKMNMKLKRWADATQNASLVTTVS